MKELREQIQLWLKENETEYYGLDRDSVNTALWRFEDIIDKVEEMQKTLEWYADDKNYHILDHLGYKAIENDDGERARQALKGDPK